MSTNRILTTDPGLELEVREEALLSQDPPSQQEPKTEPPSIDEPQSVVTEPPSIYEPQSVVTEPPSIGQPQSVVTEPPSIGQPQSVVTNAVLHDHGYVTPPVSLVKKQRYAKEYTDKERADVAKYAMEHGNAAAIRYYEHRFKLPESTVRSFKARYLRALEELSKEGKEDSCLVSLPIRKRGRKQGASTGNKPKYVTLMLCNCMDIQPTSLCTL